MASAKINDKNHNCAIETQDTLKITERAIPMSADVFDEPIISWQHSLTDK
jgi:hypothetical protein